MSGKINDSTRFVGVLVSAAILFSFVVLPAVSGALRLRPVDYTQARDSMSIDEATGYLGFIAKSLEIWRALHVCFLVGTFALALMPMVLFANLGSRTTFSLIMTGIGMAAAACGFVAMAVDLFFTPSLAELAVRGANPAGRTAAWLVWRTIEPAREFGLKSMWMGLAALWLLWMGVKVRDLVGGRRWTGVLLQITCLAAGAALLVVAFSQAAAIENWGQRGRVGSILVLMALALFSLSSALWFLFRGRRTTPRAGAEVRKDPFLEMKDQELSRPGSQEEADEYFNTLKPAGRRLILSIDGGGSLGFMTLQCLKRLEQLTLRPCHEIFDFYVGTSTGSLIAAALAKEMSAHRIAAIYRQLIPKIFNDYPKPGVFFRVLLWLVGLLCPSVEPFRRSLERLARNRFRYMYSHRALREICQEYLGNTTMGELYEKRRKNGRTKRLLITVKDMRRSETLFAVNAGPGAAAFRDLSVVDAVVGSSAAPVFIEPAGVWVDGGVGSFANPCYQATVEATEYFTGLVQPKTWHYDCKDDDAAYVHENVTHFSFGTGVIPNNVRSAQDVAKMSAADWILYALDELQDEGKDQQVRLTETRFANGNNWYAVHGGDKRVDFRRFQIVLLPDALEKLLGADLYRKRKDLVLNLRMDAHSEEELDLMEEIGKRWAFALDFTQRHPPLGTYTSPWGPREDVPLTEYMRSNPVAQ